MALLEVTDLSVDILGGARVVHSVSFSLTAGRTLGIVGESGSGKSMTATAIMGILPDVAEASGSVLFDGKDLLHLDARTRRRKAGSDIAYIFQEPMSALHPTMTIAEQMIRPMRYHLSLSKAEALERAADLLTKVGIPPERGVLGSYVHQLSGGMRQRVMIAMSISCGPRLLIADEPTTALDATVQKQILDLLMELKDSLGVGIILISHDLGLVAEYTDEVVVMLDGHVVETGPTATVTTTPAHAYTRGLLDAAPRIGQKVDRLPVFDKAAFLEGISDA